MFSDGAQKKHLQFAGSIVLGLNDAIIELTASLAGLTLALQNSKLIAIIGVITGIAASLSMAAAEYLSTKEENLGKSPFIASIYTGITYLAVVALLVLPYFFFSNALSALSVTVITAVCIIFFFTLYISRAKQLSFPKRFLEMATISLGIAAVNFLIGFLIKKYLNIDV